MLVVILCFSCSSVPKAAAIQTTPFDYLKTRKENRYFRHLFVGKHLWLFSSNLNSVLIVAKEEEKTIDFENLPIFPCVPPTQPKSPEPNAAGIVESAERGWQPVNPECKAYPDWVFRSNGKIGRVIQGLRIENGKVLLNLDKDKIYTFEPNGDLITFEKASFINDGPYAALGWRVDEKGYLFFKDKKIETRPWHFRFSGSYLAAYHKELKQVSLLDVNSGKSLAVFPEPTYKGTRLVEAVNGFYVEKDRRFIRWYGKSVIDLSSNDKNVCYVFEGKKKCIVNPDGKLRRVTENKYFRTYIGEWTDLYIEFK